MSSQRVLQLKFIVALVLTTSHALGAISLSPEKVAELTLNQGLQTKTAQLQATRAQYALSQALGVYDINVAITPGYEYNKAQLLSGQSNVVDKTFTLGSTLSKRFSSGTTLTLEYIDTRQRSVLSAFAAANRAPTANLNAVQLGIRQSLVRNAFGVADRLTVSAADDAWKISSAVRDESIEQTLISVMEMFWTAYVLDKSYVQNKAAREKYEQLVKDVRRQRGYKLTSPGELPRLEAELQAANARELSSFTEYSNAVLALLTTLRVETTEEVVLEVPNPFPEMPTLAKLETSELRSIRIAETNLKNADRNLDAVESWVRPQVDLVARARSTGVDPAYESAREELLDGNRPTYFVGVELVTPIFSKGNRGLLADARVQQMIAQNDAVFARDSSLRLLTESERAAKTRYEVVKLATETIKRRERVVAEMERAYRQGRDPLVELIRAYNDLFNARIEEATAISEYNLSLSRLAASRDELVR